MSSSRAESVSDESSLRSAAICERATAPLHRLANDELKLTHEHKPDEETEAGGEDKEAVTAGAQEERIRKEKEAERTDAEAALADAACSDERALAAAPNKEDDP